ncbi:MAG TPA: hypothetical protein VGT77_02580 [Sphingomonas sp.]|jgi:hypothetical protein|nr:hypothetical protein [Sphingomonas sp.]
MAMIAALAFAAGAAHAADCCKEGVECCKQHKPCCDHEKGKPEPKPEPKPEDGHAH